MDERAALAAALMVHSALRRGQMQRDGGGARLRRNEGPPARLRSTPEVAIFLPVRGTKL
jgi:hypothetical protein